MIDTEIMEKDKVTKHALFLQRLEGQSLKSIYIKYQVVLTEKVSFYFNKSVPENSMDSSQVILEIVIKKNCRLLNFSFSTFFYAIKQDGSEYQIVLDQRLFGTILLLLCNLFQHQIHFDTSKRYSSVLLHYPTQLLF